MTKNERAFIYKLVKRTEEKFGVICYAHQSWNTPKTNIWWDICINNYEMYTKDDEYKKWKDSWHKLAKAKGISLLFAYCNPIESNLVKFANDDNLIMNI